MSLALSSADDAVIQRTISIPATTGPILRDELEVVYALKNCAEWIIQNNFQRIALQFPDELLSHSVPVYRSLERLSQRSFFILGDTTYGSCCVDEIAAEHASCDALIHFGPSCLSPTSRLPVALVFPSIHYFNAQEFITLLEDFTAKSNNTDVVIVYDTSFFAILGTIQPLLPPNCTISQLVIPEGQTVICSDPTCLVFLQPASCSDTIGTVISHRRFVPQPQDRPLSSVTFLYIGSSSPSMVNLFLQLSSSPFYSYDPNATTAPRLQLESAQINRRIMRRLYLTERAKDARIVGILVGTLGVRDYLDIIERLKKIIKTAGKRFYTFSMGKPNPAKLANFMEVDVFVYVACPESYFDSKEYLKPVVTPHELEIACGQRPIDEGFVPDFRSLLPGGQAHVEVVGLEEGTPDVSLITGAARVAHVEGGVGVLEVDSGELVLHDRILTVSTQASAGDFLASRAWRGLEPNYGQDAAGDIVDGLHGIAMSYAGEATIENGNGCRNDADKCCGKGPGYVICARRILSCHATTTPLIYSAQPVLIHATSFHRSAIVLEDLQCGHAYLRRRTGFRAWQRGFWIKEGERAEAGALIVRQVNLQYHPGEHVGIGGDKTLYALEPGRVFVTSEIIDPKWGQKFVEEAYGTKKSPMPLKFKHFLVLVLRSSSCALNGAARIWPEWRLESGPNGAARIWPEWCGSNLARMVRLESGPNGGPILCSIGNVSRRAPQCFNPCKERTLDLRGCKVSMIENLGATLDQFDCIDFSENDIRKLDGFPLLYRIKTLLLNNNRICRIGENLHESLPSIESLILTNNVVQELGDIDPLATLKKLQYLSFLRNPVTNHPHYRLYVIHKLPSVRVLDFRRVMEQERKEASVLFKGKKGKQLEKELGQKTKSVIGGMAGLEAAIATSGRTQEEVDAIKSAISNARSLEEIERLHEMLQAGQIPGAQVESEPAVGGENTVEEEDDMESVLRATTSFPSICLVSEPFRGTYSASLYGPSQSLGGYLTPSRFCCSCVLSHWLIMSASFGDPFSDISEQVVLPDPLTAPGQLIESPETNIASAGKYVRSDLELQHSKPDVLQEGMVLVDHDPQLQARLSNESGHSHAGRRASRAEEDLLAKVHMPPHKH
ncbi:Diphthamide biosynthesis protein 2 [Hypsibius exemplaris]|uniref:2-(3-amino-3-carboxypropyl)histidine synthase subunit 2 n=1 Tax=Hypsibius exemplaris TaxID=2072580 RepID=A0A1W0WLY7_HYPEX|nr:Diphthamide biosynthesis protein 2 [Hypsibius exemplaris]